MRGRLTGLVPLLGEEVSSQKQYGTFWHPSRLQVCAWQKRWEARVPVVTVIVTFWQRGTRLALCQESHGLFPNMGMHGLWVPGNPAEDRSLVWPNLGLSYWWKKTLLSFSLNGLYFSSVHSLYNLHIDLWPEGIRLDFLMVIRCFLCNEGCIIHLWIFRDLRIKGV